MSRNQFNNADDLRSSIKNGARKKKKGNMKKILLPLLLVALIVIVTLIITNSVKNKNITPQEVTEYNYFITSINGKSGVIDKTGKTIIEPQYSYIQIPNPEKPVFVCYETNNTSKVLNENNKEILTKYKNIQAISNNNTSIQNTYQTQVLR